MNLTLDELKEFGVTPDAIDQKLQALEQQEIQLDNDYAARKAGFAAQIDRLKEVKEQLNHSPAPAAEQPTG